WTVVEPPIIQGENMTGIFSVAFWDTENGVAVGGNYEKQNLQNDHILYTKDGGKSWIHPATPTRGLMECVEYLNETTLISTGVQGSDISRDSGNTWKSLSDEKQ